NGCYSYHHINDDKTDRIRPVTFDYIKFLEEKIDKQPNIALRSVKVELLDILQHHQRLSKELQEYVTKINSIASKGNWLEDEDLKKVHELGHMSETLSEFLYQIEDSIWNILRSLLEHFSNDEIGDEFLNSLSPFISPFDSIGKSVVNSSKTPTAHKFNAAITIEVRNLIAENLVNEAIGVLLKNSSSKELINKLTLHKQQWTQHEEKKILNLASYENLRIESNQIIDCILKLL
ncbi:MAG: hypothetical protein IT258_19330, partial [Saprospiraceae bacterium]|nr:hypothetical protein [Saprospiraceae bacterium]